MSKKYNKSSYRMQYKQSSRAQYDKNLEKIRESIFSNDIIALEALIPYVDVNDYLPNEVLGLSLNLLNYAILLNRKDIVKL